MTACLEDGGSLDSVSQRCWSYTACVMDSEVSNGSGLEAEHITNLLVFGFLQSSDSNFHQELEVLGQELPVQAYLVADFEGELQTDGSQASRPFYHGRIEPDSESQEEVIQNIARHLAQVGDEMDQNIQPTLVRQLATQFMNSSLSEEKELPGQSPRRREDSLPQRHGQRQGHADNDHAVGQKGGQSCTVTAPRCLPHDRELY
ncbi:BH3-interacting domain death agonist isoform X2 [Mastomys coucha]|uniref:BH3-interacting domain death agonist isoform X2 n=1 Tax=Mastomys coucha TaxID=35658 RepID=UPI0012627C90|nr:BH3-interacting domain death agonist isoform X2 [Mastomys coucha]